MSLRSAASRLAAAALPALLGLLVLSVAGAAPASSLQATSSGQQRRAAELSGALSAELSDALGADLAQPAAAELSVGLETRVRGSGAETNVGAWVFGGASAGLHPGKLRWPPEIAEGAVFRYDHGGRRISASGPSGARSWLWSGDEVVEEEQAGTARVYERAGGLVLGFAAVDTSNYSVLGHESFVTDGLGSVVARVPDVPGAIAWHRYDAWGVFRLGAANDGTAPGPAGATLYGAEGRACLTCPQRFTAPGAGMSSPAFAGQYWDAEAGLSYAEQRWYAPELGSFLSVDPMLGTPSDPASMHVWGYGNGSPTRYVDPRGTVVWAELGEGLKKSGKKAAIAAGNALLFAVRPTSALAGGATGEFRQDGTFVLKNTKGVGGEVADRANLFRGLAGAVVDDPEATAKAVWKAVVEDPTIEVGEAAAACSLAVTGKGSSGGLEARESRACGEKIVGATAAVADLAAGTHGLAKAGGAAVRLTDDLIEAGVKHLDDLAPRPMAVTPDGMSLEIPDSADDARKLGMMSEGSEPDALKPMLGAKGTKITSKTIWKGRDGARIDVENPNPGQRPGQLHYQKGREKYLYDPESGTFVDAPGAVNEMLKDKSFQAGIQKGMRYLGEVE